MDKPSVASLEGYPDGWYTLTNKYWISRACKLIQGKVWIHSIDLGWVNTHAIPDECKAKGCTLRFVSYLTGEDDTVC